MPLILSRVSTVYKMQGCTDDYEVIYLDSQLFDVRQAYVALSCRKSLDCITIEESDCSKLAEKVPCNIDALN